MNNGLYITIFHHYYSSPSFITFIFLGLRRSMTRPANQGILLAPRA
jgi:hypothetical protein